MARLVLPGCGVIQRSGLSVLNSANSKTLGSLVSRIKTKKKRHHPCFAERGRLEERGVVKAPSCHSAESKEVRMLQSSAGGQQFDPYNNFRFRVKWDGRHIAGVSKISALKRTTEVVKHQEGGNAGSSRKSPGRTEFESITLERGVTHDTEFEKWANQVLAPGSGAGSGAVDFRKDLTIEIYNEAGQLALAYKVYRCWVSEFQALPELDANANAVAIELIKVENEGWERDDTVLPPDEATAAGPAA
jgi:phage tail-like protein